MPCGSTLKGRGRPRPAGPPSPLPCGQGRSSRWNAMLCCSCRETFARVPRCAAVWEGFQSMSMAGRSFAFLALPLVASCSGQLPNTALSRHEVNSFYRVNDSTPLVALVRERHIAPPDQASTTPLLDQLQAELAKSDRSGRYNGVTYELTRGNVLGSGWIVQTPDAWGRRAADLKFYPLDCKDCEKDVLLPSCSSDADCGGGTCGTIWPAPGSNTRRKVCLGHSDALLVGLYDLIAGARSSVDVNLLQPAPDARFLGARS